MYVLIIVIIMMVIIIVMIIATDVVWFALDKAMQWFDKTDGSADI